MGMIRVAFRSMMTVWQAGVIRPIGGHRAEMLTFGDLVEQLRRYWTVAVAAGGESHRPDIRSARIHGQMHLAPLAPALNAMLARLRFAIAQELDAGAV
jgi:hypothetical protein